MNKTILISFISSVIVFSACYFYFNVKISVMKTRIDSEVKAPISFALEDIVKDFNNGYEKQAIEKLSTLQKEWQEYRVSNELTSYKIGNILNILKDIKVEKFNGYLEKNLKKITLGMSEREVIDILGCPDEIQVPRYKVYKVKHLKYRNNCEVVINGKEVGIVVINGKTITPTKE